MGDVNKLMKAKNVQIRRGEKGLHRAQGIVERFNRTLVERLFGHQYAQEILLEILFSNPLSLQIQQVVAFVYSIFLLPLKTPFSHGFPTCFFIAASNFCTSFRKFII